MQQETQRAEELLHCLMREALLRSAAQLLPEAQISTCRKKETPADGVITGYGVIDGNLVYVYSQDAAVLNGAIGEMHAKKIANIYDMAMKMGSSCHRSYRLCRIETSGSYGCFRSLLEVFTTSRQWHRELFRRLRRFSVCAAADLQLFRDLLTLHSWKKKAESFCKFSECACRKRDFKM